MNPVLAHHHTAAGLFFNMLLRTASSHSRRSQRAVHFLFCSTIKLKELIIWDDFTIIRHVPCSHIRPRPPRMCLWVLSPRTYDMTRCEQDLGQFVCLFFLACIVGKRPFSEMYQICTIWSELFLHFLFYLHIWCPWAMYVAFMDLLNARFWCYRYPLLPHIGCGVSLRCEVRFCSSSWDNGYYVKVSDPISLFTVPEKPLLVF